MEKIVKQLKQVVRFKDSTDIGDLVLIVVKEPQIQASYALVTDIERDISRKDEWWHVGLTLLSIPPRDMTWTLRTAQLTGMEVFTMGGEQRFVKAVDLGAIDQQQTTTPDGAGEQKQSSSRLRTSQTGKNSPFLKRIK
jgi:hypothetical protein